MAVSNIVNLKEREFNVVLEGQSKKYKIVKPNFIQGNKADLIYKAAFNEAIRAGIPSAVQMKEYIDTQECFTKSSDSLRKLDAEIESLCAELDKLSTEEEATPIILKIKESRARKMYENFKLNSVYENTAETYAEALRNQFYASELLRDANGGRVFKTFEEFKARESDSLSQEAILNVMMFMARISDNFQMEYSENKWMLERGLINEAGDYIGVKKDATPEPNKDSGNISEQVSITAS